MWTIDPAIGLGFAVAVVAFCLFYYLRALYERERERDRLLAQRKKKIRRLQKILAEKRHQEPSLEREPNTLFH